MRKIPRFPNIQRRINNILDFVMKMKDIASLSVGVDKVGVKNARNTLRGKEKIWKQTRKQCSNDAGSMLGISKFLSKRSEKGHAYHPPQVVNVRQQCKFALLT